MNVQRDILTAVFTVLKQTPACDAMVGQPATETTDSNYAGLNPEDPVHLLVQDVERYLKTYPDDEVDVVWVAEDGLDVRVHIRRYARSR